MTIDIERKYGYYLTVRDNDLEIIDNIEKMEYITTAEGSKINKSDIDTNYLDMFTSVLDDMMYYRKAEYDSSSLIERLFDKLPTNKQQELLKELNNNYAE